MKRVRSNEGVCALCALMLSACGGAAIEGSEISVYVPVGEPALELGYYVDQAFEPLTERAPAPVVEPRQGGFWTMPSIRLQGLALPALVTCTLVTHEGERLSESAVRPRFYAASDGSAEARFPMSLRREAEEPIDALFGAEAVLSCSAADEEGLGSSAARTVVLAEG